MVLHADGGGEAPAPTSTIRGREKVARTLVAWVHKTVRAASGFTLREVDVNGQPGAMVINPEGRLIGVLALDIADGQVQAVSSIVNPDKLRHLGPLANPV